MEDLSSTPSSTSSTGGSRVDSPFNTASRRVPPLSKQLEAITTASVEAAALDPVKLPRLTVPSGKYKGKYVMEEWLKRHNKPRSSWVHDYGFNLAAVWSDGNTASFWACKLCDRVKGQCQLYPLGSSTSPIVSHLNKQHQVDQRGFIRSETQPTISESFKQQQSQPRETASLDQKFRSVLLRLILANNLPFSIVENKEFRELFELFGGEQFNAVCPRSRSTVRAWMNEEYKKQQQQQQSQTTQSKANPEDDTVEDDTVGDDTVEDDTVE